MKRMLAVVSLLIVLVGCGPKEETLTEVPLSQASNDVQSFIENSVAGTNLYYAKQDELYIFLTNGIVEEGDDAAYFTNAQVENRADGLTFTYDKTYTDELQNETFAYEVLYKINADHQTYDTIRALENGEETSFSIVTGN